MLERKGLVDGSSLYNKLDCLESGEDLANLLGVLASIKNPNGSRPILTTYMIMGNPDFQQIVSSDFQVYHHLNLCNSYENYGPSDQLGMWEQGICECYISPEYHGREHLNVEQWMKDLGKLAKVRIACENGFFAVKTDKGVAYLHGHSSLSETDYHHMVDRTLDGIELFAEVFKKRPRCFTACNYVWPQQMEEPLQEAGINSIHTQCRHLDSNFISGRYRKRSHVSGQRSVHGPVFAVRNIHFEPFQCNDDSIVEFVVSKINQVFSWGGAAIMTTHRVNYVGGMDYRHRDRSLKLLERLLNTVVALHPSVEFVSASRLHSIMTSTRE